MEWGSGPPELAILVVEPNSHPTFRGTWCSTIREKPCNCWIVGGESLPTFRSTAEIRRLPSRASCLRRGGSQYSQGPM
jgi:hypothetical protein